jgi:hypothetical protein
MSYIGYLPLAFGITLVVANVLDRRLYAAAQPLRLELAEKGERLLAERGLPDDLKNSTRLLLNTAFGGGWLIFGGIIGCPFMVLAVIIRPSMLSDMTKRLSRATPEARALHQDVMSLHDSILLANHPFLWTIFQAELILALPVMLVIISVLRGKMPEVVDRLMFLSMMESREVRFFKRRAMA